MLTPQPPRYIKDPYTGAPAVYKVVEQGSQCVLVSVRCESVCELVAVRLEFVCEFVSCERVSGLQSLSL